MKTLKLTPFLLGVVLLFTYCAKEEMEMAPVSQDDSAITLKDQHLGDDCNIVQTLWAGAGQNDTDKGTNVGYVTASIDWPYLNVTYTMTGAWALTEVHLWVGDDPYDVPKNAAPGRFPYKDNLDYSSEYTFEPINLDEMGFDQDDMVYVAAHGVVHGINGLENIETILPGEVGVEVYYHGTYNLEDSYFKVDISDGGVLNGLHEGWCLDSEVFMNWTGPDGFASFDADVYTSFNVPQHLFDNPENLSMVNCLINQDLDAYSLQDIQVAIWVLMEGWGVIDEISGGGYGVDGYNMDNVEALYELAMVCGEDYVPGCGEYMAIILVNDNQQTLFIPYMIPCEDGEETIWGYGEHTFIDLDVAKKWGWVFEVDLGACDQN